MQYEMLVRQGGCDVGRWFGTDSLLADVINFGVMRDRIRLALGEKRASAG